MKFVNFKIKPVEYKRQSAKLLPLNLFLKEYTFSNFIALSISLLI